jgi:uncharacterized membrane protein YccC
MAKTKSPVAAKIFGGLFHTKVGFFITLALIGLVITAIEPEYLPNLFSRFLNGIIGPVIVVALLVYAGKRALGSLKKFTGH